MENGALAPKEQMLLFPLYFQIHDISNSSRGVINEQRVNTNISEKQLNRRQHQSLPKEMLLYTNKHTPSPQLNILFDIMDNI